jgi:hypothetical protein
VNLLKKKHSDKRKEGEHEREETKKQKGKEPKNEFTKSD